MDRQTEFVLRSMEERDVRYVRLWFTDVLGFLKTVAIAPAELESAFGEGVGFDGSAIEGFARVLESDMVAHPDPTTFQLLPWRRDDETTARMFCDIRLPDGSPAPSDPRHVLKRTLEKASAMGFTFYTHPEIEFFLLEKSIAGGPVPIDQGGYFDHTFPESGSGFRRKAISMLEALGISVEYSHHEGAPGQHEIDLRYADALTTADNIMTFRMVVKQVATREGIYATFMPKPFTAHPGSAMHTHMSLFEGERNAFFDGADAYRLSTTGKQFVAGILRHAREINAVTNQWVNSYTRMAGRDEAPAHVSWGRGSRGSLVRVPLANKDSSARIELRSIDSAANPYLAYAMALAAGLRGIEQGYELPDPVEEDVASLSERERRVLGIEPLPRDLGEAVAVMESSELAAETLGEHVLDYFLRNKRAEFDDYRREVTQFELDRLLPVL